MVARYIHCICLLLLDKQHLHYPKQAFLPGGRESLSLLPLSEDGMIRLGENGPEQVQTPDRARMEGKM